MQRRKFVAGLGALAGGASVAMGTGALSATEANRHLTGNIAHDNNAYTRLYGTSQHGHHVEYRNGQLHVNFTAGNGDGIGVNSNASSWFDHVFFVEIDDVEGSPMSEGDYEFWIELNVSRNAHRIDFYRGQQRGNSIVGEGNRVGFWSGGGSRGSVGIMLDLEGIDLNDYDSIEDVFGVTDGQDLFTVHVDNKA